MPFCRGFVCSANHLLKMAVAERLVCWWRCVLVNLELVALEAVPLASLSQDYALYAFSFVSL